MSLTISFFSNFFNAHQLPVARELDANPGVDYAFVAMQRVEGLEGRACLNDDYPFVVKQYLGGSEAEEAMAHAVGDDIVVFGDMAGDESYVRARAETGKPFFRYSERLLKRGDWWAYVPPKRYRTYDRWCSRLWSGSEKRSRAGSKGNQRSRRHQRHADRIPV